MRSFRNGSRPFQNAAVLVGKVLPRLAVRDVVLAHRAPGALAHGRADRLPLARPAGGCGGEPLVLGGAKRRRHPRRQAPVSASRAA